MNDDWYRGETVNTLWIQAARRCLSSGANMESRNGPSREIIGFQYTVREPEYGIAVSRRPKLHYLAGELLWYLSGTANLDQICFYAPQYKNFSNDGVTTHGAYGERIFSAYANLFTILDELRRNPNTRQAVMPIFRPDDCKAILDGGCKDIPCTVALQFLLRQNRLCLICTMRSNDVWLGLPYDAFCWTSIQRMMAHDLGVEVGWYQHNVGSMHVYEKDIEKVKECLERRPEKIKVGSSVCGENITFHSLRDYLEIEEKSYRLNNQSAQTMMWGKNAEHFGAQLCAMMLTKTNKEVPGLQPDLQRMSCSL